MSWGLALKKELCLIPVRNAVNNHIIIDLNSSEGACQMHCFGELGGFIGWARTLCAARDTLPKASIQDKIQMEDNLTRCVVPSTVGKGQTVSSCLYVLQRPVFQLSNTLTDDWTGRGADYFCSVTIQAIRRCDHGDTWSRKQFCLQMNKYNRTKLI